MQPDLKLTGAKILDNISDGFGSQPKFGSAELVLNRLYSPKPAELAYKQGILKTDLL